MNNLNEIQKFNNGLKNVKYKPLDALIISCKFPKTDEVVARVKSIFSVIITRLIEDPEMKKWKPSDFPSWFTDTFVPEMSNEEYESLLTKWHNKEITQIPWSYSDWSYWFESDQKSWQYLGIKEDDLTCEILLTVAEWPIPIDAIKYIFTAVGLDEDDYSIDLTTLEQK